MKRVWFLCCIFLSVLFDGSHSSTLSPTPQNTTTTTVAPLDVDDDSSESNETTGNVDHGGSDNGGTDDDDDDAFQDGGDDDAELPPWVEILLYASIPVISGLVGWITNVIALKMTFYPVKFIGLHDPLCGWQGIIPRKAEKMAGKSVDLMTTQLFKVKDLFSRLDAAKVPKIVTPLLQKTMGECMNEVAEEHMSYIWSYVPDTVREEIQYSILSESQFIMQSIMAEMKERIEEIFDLKYMVVKKLAFDDPECLIDLFQEVGAKEFVFIERSGFYFGFLFGLIQMVIWIEYPEYWILPFFGLLVGWATNFFALKCIFAPVSPKEMRCGPFSCLLHGVFMRRQKEVSALYGKMVAKKVLTAKAMYESMLTGPSSGKLYALVEEQIENNLGKILDKQNQGYFTKLMVDMTCKKEYEEAVPKIKKKLKEKFVALLPEMFVVLEDYSEEALQLESTMRDKMASLPYLDFEGALHPVFEEDEWILITVGAVLGMIVGFLQIPLQAIPNLVAYGTF